MFRLLVATFLVLALVAAGCGAEGTSILPQPVYTNQVDAYFPEDGSAPTVGGEASSTAPVDEPPTDTAVVPPPADAETTAVAPVEAPVDVGAEEARVSLRDAAERCAARLNGHRAQAELVSIIQGVISGFGGLTSGVGGVMSAIDFGDPNITTAMGVMSSIGAGITLVGNLVIGLLANPLEESRRHGLGLRSWELAVELHLGGADDAATLASLERCAADEPPPVRVVGTGVVFSL